LGNVPLSRVDMRHAVELVGAWVRQEPFRMVVTPNVDHVVKLQCNWAFREAYRSASLSLVDGMPIVWAARYLRLPPLEKVSGSDLVPILCSRAAADGWHVFFVGGRSEMDLEDGLALMREQFPGLSAGGTCPRRGFDEDQGESERLVETINEFRTELLLFACGSPKSEIWMHRYGRKLRRGVGIAIGAGMRYVSGRARRAPPWMQHSGLEWLWRLTHEPLHLASRYLWDDLQFFPLVWRWKHSKER
jgi:N-acetylglucosaminyldiphosphoundecaprenol N-acetyl-beta-D-mannosaminyltransferase